MSTQAKEAHVPCTPISSTNKTDHTDITKIVESGTKHHKLKPILIGLSIFWLDMVKQIDIYECIKSIKYQILVFWILTKAIESSESHRPGASHWQTLSHNVVSCTCHLSKVWIHNNSPINTNVIKLVDINIWGIYILISYGSCLYLISLTKERGPGWLNELGSWIT
jgi:hypothetical protein